MTNTDDWVPLYFSSSAYVHDENSNLGSEEKYFCLPGVVSDRHFPKMETRAAFTSDLSWLKQPHNQDNPAVECGQMFSSAVRPSGSPPPPWPRQIRERHPRCDFDYGVSAQFWAAGISHKHCPGELRRNWPTTQTGVAGGGGGRWVGLAIIINNPNSLTSREGFIYVCAAHLGAVKVARPARSLKAQEVLCPSCTHTW